MRVDQHTEDPFSSRQKNIVFVKYLADDIKVSIPDVKRPWLFEVEGFIMLNHDIGRILPAGSQRNTTDTSIAITDSSATDYDSRDESSVCSTPLPPLNKLDMAKSISGPKTIKSILRLKSIFKAETLKGVLINEPSSAPAKGNKISSSSKVNSALADKLKADDIKVSIPDVKRPWLFEVEGFIMLNHDIGRILPAGSQRNTTDTSIAITDSSATDYDSRDESSVCSTPLPPLNKLDMAKSISGPKTIKSILRLKSIFKAETLKGVLINEPSSAPAKGNKISSSSKVNSALADKLKGVKIKDDPPLAIVMKELNNLKLQISKNQSSYLLVQNEQNYDFQQEKY
nr:hypothetical protein [Tanacetum cinerariifolium]